MVNFFKKLARRRAERKAMKLWNRKNEPYRRRTIPEEEQLGLVAAEVDKELKESRRTKESLNNIELVKLIQDCTEQVIRDALPIANIRVAGLGTFKLSFKHSEKYNPDPNKILSAGYKFNFLPSKKILNRCKDVLRKTIDISNYS